MPLRATLAERPDVVQVRVPSMCELVLDTVVAWLVPALLSEGALPEVGLNSQRPQVKEVPEMLLPKPSKPKA